MDEQWSVCDFPVETMPFLWYYAVHYQDMFSERNTVQIRGISRCCDPCSMLFSTNSHCFFSEMGRLLNSGGSQKTN